MKRHIIINRLLDKEAEQQGYDIDQRDAFMAGCDAVFDYLELHIRLNEDDWSRNPQRQLELFVEWDFRKVK